MCQHPAPSRRRALQQLAVGGFALSPLASLLSACGGESWPEGMTPIKWDRDTCSRCSMVISDRRFAAELRGGPREQVFKFDDPGCLIFWLKEKAAELPWLNEAATRLWVADFSSKGERMQWHDARNSHYQGGRTSPMGYNYAAIGYPQAGSLDFASVREHILAKGK